MLPQRSPATCPGKFPVVLGARHGRGRMTVGPGLVRARTVRGSPAFPSGSPVRDVGLPRDGQPGHRPRGVCRRSPGGHPRVRPGVGGRDQPALVQAGRPGEKGVCGTRSGGPSRPVRVRASVGTSSGLKCRGMRHAFPWRRDTLRRHPDLRVLPGAMPPRAKVCAGPASRDGPRPSGRPGNRTGPTSRCRALCLGASDGGHSPPSRLIPADAQSGDAPICRDGPGLSHQVLTALRCLSPRGR